MISLWVTRVVSTVCGLLMVAAAGTGSQGPGRAATMLAVVAVMAGMIFRLAATLALLLTVSVIVLSGPAATLAAVSGLSAAVYLVLRHSASTHAGPDTLSLPTVVGAVSFTFAGLVATAFPLQAPWLPLAAPLAVVAIYLLATWPFLGERKS